MYETGYFAIPGMVCFLKLPRRELTNAETVNEVTDVHADIFLLAFGAGVG